MVQCSRGSGSVPVSFMPEVLGCTKRPYVGTQWVRHRLVMAGESVGDSLMSQREQNLHDQICIMRLRKVVKGKSEVSYMELVCPSTSGLCTPFKKNPYQMVLFW